ncbi:DNA-binding domain-containing protein [Enterovibrio sp. ZSDZ42]|uniref:DNA-binding domain-containing protein n=1 Tax=Enterovibrio gelatinilyticus TaxID=2899819 RepID=A0ABT5R819_9GAMM|nr:DNA-binding domain-containing protein [Enterovibrio sp. ZSDZ42]MDD1795657.1 DNA-binding domain-containing protein [Enterovibrio sp. ZSDZ42]
MTSPDLASLQRQFGDALHYQPHELPVEHGVTSPDALLQVYRNNFVMTLSECLTVVYPVVKALVGDVCFDAIARQHVLHTQMKDACVDRYGEGFNHTITAIPNIIEAVPYLADIATLEWHIQTVNQAVVPPAPFPVDALALVPPEEFGDIHLHVSPAAKIIQSDFAISQIWDAVTRQDEEQLQSIDFNSAESVLIHFRHDTLTVTVLDAIEAGLIDACAHSPFRDIAPEQLQHIASAMQRGVFTDFNLTRTP